MELLRKVVPLLSIDLDRGIFRRYLGRNVCNGKPKLAHRRDINDDDWRAFRDNKELLSVDEIEAYRQRGNRDDVVAPPKRPDNEGPRVA